MKYVCIIVDIKLIENSWNNVSFFNMASQLVFWLLSSIAIESEKVKQKPIFKRELCWELLLQCYSWGGAMGHRPI